MAEQSKIPFREDRLEEIIAKDERDARLRSIARMAHKAIHDPNVKSLNVDGVDYPVYWSGNGCRYIDYKDIKFMEQDKKKDTATGILAREGMRITWGIRFGSWIYIDDDVITW